MHLRWGLRWGLLWGIVVGSGKVVSDTAPTIAVGSSSMTIHRDLGSLCRSLGKSPEKE